MILQKGEEKVVFSKRGMGVRQMVLYSPSYHRSSPLLLSPLYLSFSTKLSQSEIYSVEFERHKPSREVLLEGRHYQSTRLALPGLCLQQETNLCDSECRLAYTILSIGSPKRQDRGAAEQKQAQKKLEYVFRLGLDFPMLKGQSKVYKSKDEGQLQQLLIVSGLEQVRVVVGQKASVKEIEGGVRIGCKACEDRIDLDRPMRLAVSLRVEPRLIPESYSRVL